MLEEKDVPAVGGPGMRVARKSGKNHNHVNTDHSHFLQFFCSKGV